MATSVGAIIKRNGKYLIMDRVFPPHGFSFVSGHVEKNQTPEQALKAEVKEESGLTLTKYKKIINKKFLKFDRDSFHNGHYWYIYTCTANGKVKKYDHEAKSMRWYSKKQIKKLKLVPVAKYVFKKLNII